MSTGMRMTLAEYERLQKRSTESTPAATERPQARPAAKAALPRAPRGMNKLERRYSHRLDMEKFDGQIISWTYESIRLKLADDAWYKPDFVVLQANGEIRVDECKGFMREAAHVRIKVAASLYPMFRFSIIRWNKGEWTRTRVPG